MGHLVRKRGKPHLQGGVANFNLVGGSPRSSYLVGNLAFSKGICSMNYDIITFSLHIKKKFRYQTFPSHFGMLTRYIEGPENIFLGGDTGWRRPSFKRRRFVKSSFSGRIACFPTRENLAFFKRNLFNEFCHLHVHSLYKEKVLVPNFSMLFCSG